MATKKGAKKELPTGQGLDPGKTVGKPVVQEPTVEETAVVPGQKEAGNSQPEPERQELPAEDVPLEPERQESSAVDPLPESERQEPPATDPSLEPEEMPHAMAGQGMAEPDPPGEAVLEEKLYRIACRNKVTETIGGVKFVDGVGYTGDGQELPAEDVPLEPERQESSAVDPLPESERQEPPATDPSLEPEEMPHAMAGQGMAEPDPPGEAVLEEKRYRIACRNKVTETIGGVKFVDGVGYTGDGFSASWFANKSGYEVSLADPGERG